MNQHKMSLYLFCGCFIVTLLIFVSYLWRSSIALKDSQERITTEYLKHIASIDSIFYDIKKVVLSNDSGTIVNAPVLLAQLQSDSALMRREIMLSQEEKTNLVALHIEKIDNDYSQIGIWGGVLSIIFLIFGFFAIFKIEETKTEAKNTVEEVKTQGENAIAKIAELQTQAGQLNGLFNSNKQKSSELDGLITTFNTNNPQAKESLERINKLLVEVEIKNKQYDLSIKQMSDLMEQLGQLIDTLNTSTNSVNETDHE